MMIRGYAFTKNMSNQRLEWPQAVDARSELGEHLDGVESGAGCAEIWERLSEQRDSVDASADDD